MRTQLSGLCILLGCAMLALNCKYNSTTTGSPVVACYLTKEVRVTTTTSGPVTDSSVYTYNSANVLLSVVHSGVTDTLTYSAGKLAMRQSLTTGGDVVRYTYSGNNLISIVQTTTQSGTPLTITTTMTYSGSTLTDIAQSGNPNGNFHLSNIVWSGGNVATVDFDPTGTGSTSTTIHATLAFDAKKNHMRFVVPTVAGDMLEFLCANNLVSATSTNSVTFGMTTVNPGDKILDRTYTYFSSGEVATTSEAATVFSSDPTMTTNSYQCQ